MEKGTKKNRIFSYVLGGLFILSVGVISVLSYRLVSNYRENQALRKTMEAIIANHEQSGQTSDGYYTVFVEDHYVAFDGGNVIVSFPTMK